MREYSNVISLTKNSRGIYSLDTSIGCKSGMDNEQGGCYNDCYAAKSAKLYGYDFGKTVLRDFKDEKHRVSILNKINRINLDFVRIGTSGDPSESWSHTIKVVNDIKHCNKVIVIITKHWTNLTIEQLEFLATVNVCVNTSVSALDNPDLLENSLIQYHILKKYCKSVLRIVSCDFNKNNKMGLTLSLVQDELFKNDGIIDTVLRVNKNNPLIKNEIINVSKSEFLGKKTIVSKFKKSTYFGKCSNCHEMCGLNVNQKEVEHPLKSGISKQSKIFKR